MDPDTFVNQQGCGGLHFPGGSYKAPVPGRRRPNALTKGTSVLVLGEFREGMASVERYKTKQVRNTHGLSRDVCIGHYAQFICFNFQFSNKLTPPSSY